jgi:fructan beta-fructosidase
MKRLITIALLCGIALSATSLQPKRANAADDVVIADFEGQTYSGWTVSGDAFGDGPANGPINGQMAVNGFDGDGLVNSFKGGDETTGEMTSEPFHISHKFVAFLIGGGRHPGGTGIELLIAGESVRQATGSDSEHLGWVTWDVNEFAGKQARLRIFDHETGGWGHINVDQILLTDRTRFDPRTVRLSDYRKSDSYYRELFRPHFHFTPEINWMNDPNGLVFFDGEYHLFYQHNPHGNEWGHMSWGHAVSRDLAHWEHLPIALHDEFGVMVFSGCCVVDRQNTSGFGRDDQPPMVAIYTGHGFGKQTQDLAFSIDRGRTWTKYGDNPVLDIGESDFRDPKVFWHEPTSKWVMVVSLANQKRVQFYGSPNLKDWKLLSEFGPAGEPKAPNWECPDLFELPIEGQPGKTRWVLEVDMGSGSIAGGSGGQYFIGSFDGEKFVSDRPLDEVHWVDYGRDFYAPVSWSDIPEVDGRRIWLGWMNNWQTCLVPTTPWRSAMSIPRTLALREINGQLRMVQRPVRELASIRGDKVSLGPIPLKAGEVRSLSSQLSGLRLEIDAELDVASSIASEVGIRVRVGKDEHTAIGYDVKTQQLFVDRTRSGDVSFHKAFAGRHAGPLTPIDGKVRLHIFVDDSSVEVFGNDGEIVITDRIFPDDRNTGVEVYATGGTATLPRFDGWRLKSIWHDQPPTASK